MFITFFKLKINNNLQDELDKILPFHFIIIGLFTLIFKITK